MSLSTPVRHAWKVLLWLAISILVLFGINLGGVLAGKSSWAPELALDLQGGTQIVLAASTPDGANPSQEQLDQAASIIRQRVDAAGVAEAEVAVEGGRNIVVAIPGNADEETRARIQASAQLELRAVLMVLGNGIPAFVGEDGETTPLPRPTESLEAEPETEPENGSDLAWLTPALIDEFSYYDCWEQADAPKTVPDPTQPFIACDELNVAKYLLGPVELDGSHITDATSGLDQQRNLWTVNLKFDDEGTKKFAEVSQRLYGLNIQGQSPRDQFAFLLDGIVLSAPVMQAVILDGRPSISGTFTAETSKTLADQLKFGALPLSFNVESSTTVSATLGSQQLQIGLIAGLIGLALVAIYSLFSYRALGGVIIASLIVMAVITYILICILSWRMGFRLSLAGVAGLIVAVGFCADSFIVYFERIRDELREGRPVTAAVEEGWDRAKRTIYISKSINLLAAVVLWVLADSTVKGFAFTLGLTTLIDVFIFMIFTHPVMQLLARTEFFGGGHPLSGMDAEALGAIRREREVFRKAPVTSHGANAKRAKSQGEAERRQTIAERKRAEQLAGKTSDGGDN